MNEVETKNNQSEWITRSVFSFLIIVYVVYPLFYFYSMYGRNDYLLVNNFDQIFNTLWLVLGLSALVIITRSIWLRKNNLITKTKLILNILFSLVLSVGLWAYAILISIVGFAING